MIGDLGLEVEDFAALTRADAAIAAAVAAGRCRHCGGPLHVANYERKPRGALVAAAGEGFRLRHSLCCGKRGCRRRALPPSLRFLGRRVYLEVVVVLASAWAQAAAVLRAAARDTGVPARTLGRWQDWWRGTLPQLAWWAQLRARLVPPPPDEAALPGSLLEHLGRVVGGAQLLWLAARCLAPGTTRLVDAARFARDAAAGPAAI